MVNDRYPVQKVAIAKGLYGNDWTVKGLKKFFRSVANSAFDEKELIGHNLLGSNKKKKIDGQKLEAIIRKFLNSKTLFFN